MPNFMSMIQRGSKERILLCEAKQGIAGAKRRLAKQIENQILIRGRICGPHVYFQGLNQGQWEYHRLCVTQCHGQAEEPPTEEYFPSLRTPKIFGLNGTQHNLPQSAKPTHLSFLTLFLWN